MVTVSILAIYFKLCMHGWCLCSFMYDFCDNICSYVKVIYMLGCLIAMIDGQQCSSINQLFSKLYINIGMNYI